MAFQKRFAGFDVVTGGTIGIRLHRAALLKIGVGGWVGVGCWCLVFGVWCLVLVLVVGVGCWCFGIGNWFVPVRCEVFSIGERPESRCARSRRTAPARRL